MPTRRQTLEAKIIDTAVKWVEAKDAEMAAHKRRNAQVCECVHTQYLTYGFEQNGEPCWKKHDWAAPRNEWCESCRQRQDIHESLMGLIERRAANQRSLHRYVRQLIAKENNDSDQTTNA